MISRIRSLAIGALLLLHTAPAIGQEGWQVLNTSSLPDTLMTIYSARPGHIAGFTKHPEMRTVWSTDEGLTWSRSEPAEYRFNYSQRDLVDAHFFSPAVGVSLRWYVRNWGNLGVEIYGDVLTTADSGRSWQRLGIIDPDSMGMPSNIQHLADGRVVIAFAGSFGDGTKYHVYDGGFLISSNGLDWERRGYQKLGSEMRGGQLATTDGSALIRIKSGLSNRLSLDSGKTFGNFRPEARTDSVGFVDMHSVHRLPSGTLLSLGENYIFRSVDTGANWDRVAMGKEMHLEHDHGMTYFHSRSLFPYHSPLLSLSTDDGLTWKEWTFDARPKSVAIASPTVSYALIGQEIYKRDLTVNGVDPKSIEQFDLRISSNPVSNELRLSIHSDLGGSTLSIIDMGGRTLRHVKYTPTLDVSDLPNGVYYLQLDDEGIGSRAQFVISR